MADKILDEPRFPLSDAIRAQLTLLRANFTVSWESTHDPAFRQALVDAYNAAVALAEAAFQHGVAVGRDEAHGEQNDALLGEQAARRATSEGAGRSDADQARSERHLDRS